MSLVVQSTMSITCPAFYENDVIPDKFTCDGENINPRIDIFHIPREAKSLALTFEDPDMQSGLYVHWIMWNIPPNGEIPENSAPGVQGLNGEGEHKYSGPCNSQDGHLFHLHVYALDTMIDLSRTLSRHQLLMAMEGHILAKGELICAFSALK